MSARSQSQGAACQNSCNCGAGMEKAGLACGLLQEIGELHTAYCAACLNVDTHPPAVQKGASSRLLLKARQVRRPKRRRAAALELRLAPLRLRQYKCGQLG